MNDHTLDLPLLEGSKDAEDTHIDVENVYDAVNAPLLPSELENPSSLGELITFSWVNRLLERGARQLQLEQPDLPPLPPEASPTKCTEALRRSWQREVAGCSDGQHQQHHRSASLLRALFHPFGPRYLALGGLKFLNDALNFAPPVFMNGLLRYLDASRSAAAADTPLLLSSAGAGGLLPLRSGSFLLSLQGGLWWDPSSNIYGLTCAALLTASLVLKAFLDSHFSYRQGIVSAQVRSSLTGLVFSQTLALREASLGAVGTGRVQTLMAVDTERLANLCLGFHELWSLPLQIAVALWLLYTQVQFAFLAGLVGVILIIPVNKALANAIQKASIAMMAAKDRRIAAVAELLRGAKTVLAYAWEGVIARKVNAARKEELRALATRKYLDAWCVYLWAATSILFSLGTFGLYALMGQQLTAQAVFTSLALFNVLVGPLNSFPWVINGIVEAAVSLKRLQEFLTIQIHPSPLSTPQNFAATPATVAIEIHNGSFAWGNGAGETPALHNINLSIPIGKFVVITGDVGSGKSSLLGAILGELRPVGSDGFISLRGTTAYVPQSPWAMPGSIRDNILLGAEYDAERYQEVLQACALDQDLSLMPAGDGTPVGELGGRLSGGQGARVALARALYRAETTDIFLLDDVLAAVDAHVGSWLIEKALKGPMLAGKTVLATTHSPALLAVADLVITMQSGRIVSVEERGGKGNGGNDAGSKWKRAGKLASLQAAHNKEKLEKTTKDIASDKKHFKGGNEDLVDSSLNSHKHAIAVLDSSADSSPEAGANGANSDDNSQDEEAEEREIGHVRWNVYRGYLALQGAWVPITLISLFLMQSTRVSSDLWLSYWVTQTNKGDNGDGYEESNGEGVGIGALGFPPLEADVRFYLEILLILAISNSVFTLVRAFAFAQGGLVAAKRLHTRLLDAILGVPPSFFDSTPSGRVLNRFSSDTAAADDSLPFIANIFLAQFFNLASVALVLCATQPYIAAALVPMAFLYRRLQRYYRATSREIRRLDAVAKSPVYSIFSSALSGGSTIRAFGATGTFLRSGLAAVAAQQRASLAGLAASTWLGLRLQLMAAFIAAGVSGLAVAQSSGAIGGAALSASAGFVGLSLAYILPITGLLNGLLTSGAETEQEMVAVERIEQYTDLQPQQEVLLPSVLTSGYIGGGALRSHNIDGGTSSPPLQGLAAALEASQPLLAGSPRAGLLTVAGRSVSSLGGRTSTATTTSRATRISPDWPQRGAVAFRNVYLRYGPSLPFAVEQLTMKIAPGSHVGICGRTGAGKSSTVACLLRLAEISAGEVIIDGVDVRSVPLRRLRRSIGYVPQSPFIMSGTVRDNLDPMRRYTDDQVVSALEKVRLWPILTRLFSKNTTDIATAADNSPPPTTSCSTSTAPQIFTQNTTDYSVLHLLLGEGGANLSLGQQQMLCLGRVLLQGPRIACLDESTASVDADTAAAMHEVIAQELVGCTIIEIAHRLVGLAGCDTVFVMEGGRVVEVGDPKTLARTQGSVFYGMVREQHGGIAQAGCVVT